MVFRLGRAGSEHMLHCDGIEKEAISGSEMGHPASLGLGTQPPHGHSESPSHPWQRQQFIHRSSPDNSPDLRAL
jgi:hypothetical protein